MISINPKEEYVEVKVENEIWIVGKIRLEELMQMKKIEDYQVLKTVLGSELLCTKIQSLNRTRFPHEIESYKIYWIFGK